MEQNSRGVFETRTNPLVARWANPGVMDRRLQVQMFLRKKLQPGCYGMNGCDRYEQRQSFGWLAFISCPADMRTTDTLETRDAGATLQLDAVADKGVGRSDGIGTPRWWLLSGLKNGLVFCLTSPSPISLCISLSLSPSHPSTLACFASFCCIPLASNVREQFVRWKKR